MFHIIAAVWISSCMLTGVCGEEMVKRQTPSTCTGGYEDVEKDPYGGGISTMCLDDSPNYKVGSAGVSDTEKATILRLHNEYRAELKASRMPKLHWDDELARVAEKWAKHCLKGHEGKGEHAALSRKIPVYGMVSGQNVHGDFGYDSPSWERAVKQWYTEKDVYKYGQDPKTYIVGNQMIGHYTQMIQETTTLIGCGYADCTTLEHYVCNYLGWQTLEGKIKPYKSGDACSDCPGQCSPDKKLCDCGKKFCFNDGVLDMKTCTCTCQNYYTGDQCLTLTCPENDPSHCGVPPPHGYPHGYCVVYHNVPYDCPFMCGKCFKTTK